MERFAFTRLVEKQGWLAVILVGAMILSGCTDEMARNGIDRATEKTKQGLVEAEHPSPPKHYNPLVVTDKVWGGDTAVRMHRGVPLPAMYETAHAVTLVSSTPMTLTEIAGVITQQTGIVVRAAGVGDASGASAPGVGGIPGNIKPLGTSGANAPADGMPIAYEGPLSGLLERVAGYFGVDWHYDGTAIAITKFETRVFTIEALPGAESVVEGMTNAGGTSNGGSSGGGSSGGSSSGGSSSGGANSTASSTMTQSAKYDLNFKYWDELGQILNSMLGGVGTVVVSPSIGTVAITTTPAIMHAVADYIAKENQRLSRQIAINVEVYTVTLSDGLTFNVAFSAVLKKLTNNILLSSIAGATAPTQVGGATSPSGATLSLAILGANGNSATDLFTALSTIGDATKVVKFPLITINNRTASRFIGQNLNYVSQATVQPTAISTTAATSTSSTSMATATLTPGFTVQATPRLLDDGRILLQYSLSIVDLIGSGFNTFNSACGANPTQACLTSSVAAGSTTVELPQTTNRNFVQQAVLKSGSTLMLGGASEEDLAQNSNGIGDANNFALGGGTSSSKAHTMVFYFITPQVLDEPHSEQD
jgi:type IVB pilus formation R64 PilN family outer membrane protein